MAESETLQPPRYRGSLERIEGEIDEDEALALAMECRPIELERDQVSKTPTPWLSIILLPLLVIGIIGLLVYPGNNASPTKDGASGGGPGNGASLSYESSLLWFLLVVIVVGMVLVLLIRKSKVRFADSDPPLGGHTLVKLTALGCSIVKTTRDDRLIEVFCSWRQTQVTSSENAWLLNIGLANPFLLAKKWVDNQSERSKLDELCREIANWNAHQPTPLSLDSVPEEASESFPDFQRDATKMVVSSVVERRARKQVAKQIRARLPEYRPLHTRWTRWMIWWTVLLASLVGLMLLGFFIRWSMIQSQWHLLLGIGIPMLLGLLFVLRLGWTSGREIKVEAAISDENLWYNYRALLLRMPLNSFPFRTVIGDNLIVATRSGSTTVVLNQRHFASIQAFEHAAGRIVQQ